MPRRFGDAGNSGIQLTNWKNSQALTISFYGRKLSEGNGTAFGRFWTFDNDQEFIINQSGTGLRWHRKYGAGSSFKQCDWTFPATGIAYQHMFVDAGVTDNVATDPMQFYLNGVAQATIGTSSSTNSVTPQIRTADMYIGNRAGLDRAADAIFDYYAVWEIAQPKRVAMDLASGAHPLDYPNGLIVFFPMVARHEANLAPGITNRLDRKVTWTATGGGRGGIALRRPRAVRRALFTGTSPPPPPPSNTNYLMPMLGVGDD